MAVSTPIAFRPIASQAFSPGRAIYQTPELDLANNINHLQGFLRPCLVSNFFSADAGYLLIDYAHASDRRVHASFRRSMLGDFSTVLIRFYAMSPELTAYPDAYGVVRFELGSDSSKYVEVNIAGDAGAWNLIECELTVDPTQAFDTIILSGRIVVEDLAIRSVSIWPKREDDISSAPSGSGVVGIDAALVTAQAPLSTAVRKLEIANLELMRKKRQDSIVTFSEDYGVRASHESLVTDSATFVTVAYVPFTAKKEQTQIEWSALGYYNATGSGGTIRLSTLYMETNPNAENEYVDIVLPSGWTLGAGLPQAWQDNPADEVLECLGGKAGDRIKVQLKGDGSKDAVIMGLCAWFKGIS